MKGDLFMGNEIEKVRPSVTVSAGFSTYKSDVSKTGAENVWAQGRSSYQVGTLGIETSFPTGKTSAFTPQLSAELGPDTHGIGGYLGFTKQASQNLNLSFGFGIDNRKYTTAITNTGYTIADAQETPNQGESDLATVGDFREQTDVSVTTRSASHKTTGYVAAGAKYQINPKLSVSGQLQGGLTFSNPKYSETRITDGEYVVGVTTKYDSDGSLYYYRPNIETRHDKNKYTETGAGGFTGAVKVGVDYNLNQKLAVGTEAQVGIGHYADPVRVGTHLKIKL